MTFRRWLMHCNPELAGFITELIGTGWKKDARELEKLLKFRKDKDVLEKLLAIKQSKKEQLKQHLSVKHGIALDVNSIFDIQVKRLHEYKRQQLNALYVIHKYLEIKEGKLPGTPITVIFGAKAAPAYTIAQDIIHLILCLQELMEKDGEVNKYLKVVMVETRCAGENRVDVMVEAHNHIGDIALGKSIACDLLLKPTHNRLGPPFKLGGIAYDGTALGVGSQFAYLAANFYWVIL